MDKVPEQYAAPWVEGMFRFAQLYLGEEEAAREVTRAVIVETAAHADDFRDQTKCGRHLFYHLRRRCMQRCGVKAARVPKTGGNLEVADVENARLLPENLLPDWFRNFPEPQRSAAIFFYLDLFETAELEKVLGLDLATLGMALRDVRLRLARLARSAPLSATSTLEHSPSASQKEDVGI